MRPTDYKCSFKEEKSKLIQLVEDRNPENNCGKLTWDGGSLSQGCCCIAHVDTQEESQGGGQKTVILTQVPGLG